MIKFTYQTGYSFVVEGTEAELEKIRREAIFFKWIELGRMTKDELIDKIDCLECALLMEQKRSARRQERIDTAYEKGFYDGLHADEQIRHMKLEEAKHE